MRKKNIQNYLKREKIYDNDIEDEESENDKEISWIILPDNSFKKMWDLIIKFLILCITIINPYEITFQDRNKVKLFDIFIDIVLIFNIKIYSRYHNA